MELIVIYLMYNFLATLSIERFMRVFFEKRTTSLGITVMSYVLYYIGGGAVFLMLDNPIYNTSSSIILVFLISLNYSSLLRKKIVITFSVVMIMAIVEIVVVVLGGGMFTALTSGVEHFQYMGMILMGIIIYTISVLAQRFKNLKKDVHVPFLMWISIVTIAILSIIIIMVIFSANMYNRVVATLGVASVLVINLFVIYLQDLIALSYENKMKVAIIENEKIYYANQLDLMKKSTEGLRAFKHDIKNHLIAISYSINNRPEEAMKHVKGLIEEVDATKSYSNSGNIALDSIINYKLDGAEEKGIEVKVNITIPTDLEIEDMGIATIFGNLLDNALEALDKTKEKLLDIYVSYEKGIFLIHMQNTYDEEVKYRNEKIISTKGDGHGYGIKNIEKFVEKYGGSVEIDTSDSTMFKVFIMFYV